MEKKIEAKRFELNLASRHHDLLSDFVLKLSVELDELLNTYYKSA
nr:aspartyl-phosphate phosphatase Spo0E family protein [Paenibacillus alba]